MNVKYFFNQKSNTAKKLLSLLSLVVLLLSGCATQSVLLGADDDLYEGEGCIYGQFGLKDYDKDFMFGLPLATSNIVIENIDTEKTYAFRLQGEEKDDLQVLAVPVGQYIIKEVEFLGKSDFGGWDRKKKTDFEMENYENDFTVEENTALYLGDFFGTAYYDFGNLSWNVFPPINNFDETTKELKEKYPLFVENNTTFVSHMKEEKETDVLPTDAAKLKLTPEQLEMYKAFIDSVNGD